MNFVELPIVQFQATDTFFIHIPIQISSGSAAQGALGYLQHPSRENVDVEHCTAFNTIDASILMNGSQIVQISQRIHHPQTQNTAARNARIVTVPVTCGILNSPGINNLTTHKTRGISNQTVPNILPFLKSRILLNSHGFNSQTTHSVLAFLKCQTLLKIHGTSSLTTPKIPGTKNPTFQIHGISNQTIHKDLGIPNHHSHSLFGHSGKETVFQIVMNF